MHTDITKISDGSLADWYFSNLDHDPEMEREETRKLDAEGERRGLTIEQLDAAQERWRSTSSRRVA